jgi:hypothetical protein
VSACLRLQSGLRRRPHEDRADETYRYFKVKILTSIRLSFLKDFVKKVQTVDFFTLRQNYNNNNKQLGETLRCHARNGLQQRVFQLRGVTDLIGHGTSHFRCLPFRNKANGGKPRFIWGLKNRIRPQCRVTTPLWAPSADSGQREKKRNRGQNLDRKMTAVRDPGVAGR